MEGLLNPSSDFVFKNLFGVEKHKRVLVCLLNAILQGRPHIESITLANPEHKKKRKDGRSITLDIEAVTDKEAIVNVEIQCDRNGNLVNRAIHHMSRLMKDELDEDESFDSMPDIISIWLTEIKNRKKIVTINEFNLCDSSSISKYKLFYKEIKIIWVFRDPRDSFTSWIKHNWTNIEKIDDFIAQYRVLNDNVSNDCKTIISVHFEDFVLNYKEISKKILRFTDISESSKLSSPIYLVEDSKKNIGQWKSYPNQEVMEKIACELKDYLYVYGN